MCIQQTSFCPFKNMNGLLNLEMNDIIHKSANFNTEIFWIYTTSIFGLSGKVSVNPFNNFHLILWLLSVDKMSSWQKDLVQVSLTWSNNNFFSPFYIFLPKLNSFFLKHECFNEPCNDRHKPSILAFGHFFKPVIF